MRYSYVPASHAAHEASMTLVAGVATYPAPEVCSRTPWPDGMVCPAPVLELERDAMAAGWTVERRYSRGRMPHASTGRPGAVRHLVGVRLARGAVRACAVYSSPAERAAWTWGSVWWLDGATPPRRLAGVTELRELLHL